MEIAVGEKDGAKLREERGRREGRGFREGRMRSMRDFSDGEKVCKEMP